VTAVEPPAYPVHSFYCALHGYQKPRAAADGLVVEPLYEAHLARRTSFLAPEHSVGAELAKAVGMVRDRPGAPKSAAGAAVAAWLVERKALTPARAAEMGARMVALGILVPVGPGAAAGTKAFSDAKDALYAIRPKIPAAAPGAPR